MTCCYRLNLRLSFVNFRLSCYCCRNPYSRSLNPIPLEVDFTKSLANGLVNGSSKLQLDHIYVSEIITSLINFLTNKFLTSTCLPQCINTFRTWSLANGTSNRMSLNHSASSLVEARASKFDSMIERVIHIYFLLFQKITPPTSVNNHQNADL